MEKIFDVHTHLDPVNLGANGLKGILGYHFITSEIVSILPENLNKFSSLKDEERIEIILNNLKNIKNTSSYWMAKKILQDIYEIDLGEINIKNWKKIDEKIKEKYRKNENWAWEILIEKCRIKKVLTSRDYPLDFKEPSSQKIFERSYEKIPFGIREDVDYIDIWEKILQKPFTIENLKKFLKEEIKKANEIGVLAYVCWMGRYEFEDVNELEVKKCIENKNPEEVRKKLSCFVFKSLLEEISLLNRKPVIQMIIGAHVDTVAATNYSRILEISNSDILYSYQKLFDRFNSLHFDLLVSSSVRARELDTISRMSPNVTLSGNWLHTMFPNQIKKIFSDRLEFLPYTKLTAFFSDAYNAEWVYGKLVLAQKCITQVIKEKIKEGWLEKEFEKQLLKFMFWNNPYRIYNRIYIEETKM